MVVLAGHESVTMEKQGHCKYHYWFAAMVVAANDESKVSVSRKLEERRGKLSDKGESVMDTRNFSQNRPSASIVACVRNRHFLLPLNY